MRTKTVEVTGSLPEIIEGGVGVYEGNLIHYFQLVFRKARNLNRPYHNGRHMLHVLYLCYQACAYYRGSCELTLRQARNLLIAALGHDFDHPGMQGDDDLNIERAIRNFIPHLLPGDKPHTGEITSIMRVTEFPHKPNERAKPGRTNYPGRRPGTKPEPRVDPASNIWTCR